jgi:hypothetical protein
MPNRRTRLHAVCEHVSKKVKFPAAKKIKNYSTKIIFSIVFSFLVAYLCRP